MLSSITYIFNILNILVYLLKINDFNNNVFINNLLVVGHLIWMGSIYIFFKKKKKKIMITINIIINIF